MICTIQQVSKMLGGNLIFENLTLNIKTGDRLGIVGRNGSGKTTLFKLIAGVEKPDAGQIHFKKGTKVGYLAQIPTFEKDVTGEEVLTSAFQKLLGIQQKLQQIEQKMALATPEELEKLLKQYGDLQEQFIQEDGYSIQAQIEMVVNGLELHSFVQQPFQSLSGGEKTKIMLGQLLLTKPDLLLLDEPTNHLDLFAVEWLEQYLVEYVGTVVVISHDRHFLDRVVTKVADLEEGELHLYHGNYSSFTIEKEARLLREFQDYEEQQKKIKKMRETIKRLRQWANEANPPNAGLHKRATSMERALERMEKLRKPLIDPKKMTLNFEAAPRSGKEVIVMEGISHSFDQKKLFHDLDFRVYWQDRAAIVGRNGTGKSTIFNLILEQVAVSEGVCRIGSNVRIGYLSQHFEIDTPKAKLIDIFRQEVSVTEGEARHILARFMFYGADVFKRAMDLSGGERMRLRLAQLMYQDINLLLLDEPTNHLDIESREVLEDALEDFQGTIVAISHDRYFLNKLFTRTSWLENGQLITFAGPFEWAREKMAERQNLQKENEPKVTTPKASATPKKEIPAACPTLEQEILALEEELQKLREEAEHAEEWSHYEQRKAVIKQKEQQLEEWFEQWINEEKEA